MTRIGPTFASLAALLAASGGAEAAEPSHLRLFHMNSACHVRPCAEWRALDQGGGDSFDAVADLTPLHLAPRLRVQALRGQIDLLVNATVSHATIGGREITRVTVHRLLGVEPHRAVVPAAEPEPPTTTAPTTTTPGAAPDAAAPPAPVPDAATPPPAAPDASAPEPLSPAPATTPDPVVPAAPPPVNADAPPAPPLNTPTSDAPVSDAPAAPAPAAPAPAAPAPADLPPSSAPPVPATPPNAAAPTTPPEAVAPPADPQKE